MGKLRLMVAVLLVSASAFGSAHRESLSPLLSNLQEWTSASGPDQSEGAKSGETQPKITAYTLPPELYQKAHARSQVRFQLYLASFVWGLVVLWIVLRWRLAAKYRELAENASHRRFLQAVVYSPLFMFTVAILSLPTDIYDNLIERKYGLSVQSWGSWAWDWTKGELVGIVVGTILIWILYIVIRRSPQRWWFYFWVVSLPIGLVLIFLQPLVVDPLFHKFEPLQGKDPGLTASLENMVRRSGEDIPPERMFWMGAGEKTTALNAYVTGIGASKRIVVWDTTIAKMDTPQIVFVAGHEMGHYVLLHIPKLIAFTSLMSLLFFYLIYRSVGWVLVAKGERWGIRAVDDWASLPVLMLLLSILAFIANPAASAVSRYYEHQADQYGLEVTQGLTPESAQVAAQSFQILGEVDLADPDPNPLAVFLYYSHPTNAERVQFALSYDPWSKGEAPAFVK